MPKQADIRVQIPGCTAAHFWDVVYERPEATERYHTSFNSSTSTSVTPWVSGQRTVNFAMPLKLPDFLKRMVGLESVAVAEVQRVVWQGGLGSFTVSSETSITNMMGAGRFTTALQLTVTEQQHQQLQPAAAGSASAAPSTNIAATTEGTVSHSITATYVEGAGGGDGRCGREDGCEEVEVEAADGSSCVVQLVYSVRCAAASIPWPMSATIENIMAEKALVSMQSFLDYCAQLLEEEQHRQHRHKQQGVAAVAALGGGDAAAVALVDGAAAATTTMTAAGAAAALLEPPTAALLSEGGVAAAGGGSRFAAAAAAAGAPPSPPLPPGPRGTLLRHRWPSITCSQDLGAGGGLGGVPGVPAAAVAGGGGGDSFVLRRADTAGGPGGGDVFWDAPETFGTGSCGSGISSGAVSPRQLLLQPSTVRRLSADCGGGGGGAAASAVAVNAVATETHQVAVAIDKLAVAVATLDSKMEKLLVLQGQQQQQLRNLQEQFVLQQQRQQQEQHTIPAYLLDHPAAATAADVRHRGSDGGARGGDSEVKWTFRVTLAVLLATLLVVGYWVIHPYSGFRPHGSSSGVGIAAGGTAPQPLPVVSVLRVNGDKGSLGRPGGDVVKGDVSGRAVEGRARLALQVLGRFSAGSGGGEEEDYFGGSMELRKESDGGDSGCGGGDGQTGRFRQHSIRSWWQRRQRRRRRQS